MKMLSIAHIRKLRTEIYFWINAGLSSFQQAMLKKVLDYLLAEVYL
jgi:hypothetical protein